MDCDIQGSSEVKLRLIDNEVGGVQSQSVPSFDCERGMYDSCSYLLDLLSTGHVLESDSIRCADEGVASVSKES